MCVRLESFGGLKHWLPLFPFGATGLGPGDVASALDRILEMMGISDAQGAATQPAGITVRQAVLRIGRTNAVTDRPHVSRAEARFATGLLATALGSRPAAYGAVAARCLLRERNEDPALDRFLPLLVLAGGDVARTVLCRAVARPRPPADERLAHCDGASFPSRHTATALIATGLATGSGPGFAGAVAAAVGLSRIALRVHWPTDVVGGWLFGYGWLAASQLLRTDTRATPQFRLPSGDLRSVPLTGPGRTFTMVGRRWGSPSTADVCR
jgi:membrane-associated phospholipid phosphatase